ncbi:DUF1173 family protein [Nocardia abscessus]|uniref:DUF1173 family protein n=1 Tax=Nocardia abscessus TaxID=120957 RepID=UPI0024577790|nr:DUF1173 family protein [Nocardia abscessus]
MAEYREDVRLAGRRFALAELREDPSRYSTFFLRARAEDGHAVCLCSPSGLRLVIRCSRAGRHHLARWPGEGQRHAPSCPFHEMDKGLSGRVVYGESAIRETVRGVSIRLEIPLVTGSPAVSTGGAVSAGESGRVRRSVSLFGLLCWLWESARLNAWHPGLRRRGWADCYAALGDGISDTTINRIEVARALYTVAPFTPDSAEATADAFDRFLAGLTGGRRGLVLGELVDTTPTGRGTPANPGSIRYKLAHSRRPLYVGHRLDERARRSYRSAFSKAVQRIDHRRIVLAVVERSRGGHAAVVDLAVLLTSRQYLPADSSHEVSMAAALVDAGRSLVKPLRYDAEESVVFPDFILTDSQPATVVEVWGLPGRADYEARKAVKLTEYRESGVPLIEWTITEPFPRIAGPPSPR